MHKHRRINAHAATSLHHPAGAPVAASKTRPVLLGVLLIAQLMVILDITAVNIALPSLATDLDLRGSSVSWTITSYSLIFGSLLLLGGRAADLLGRRRVFVSGLAFYAGGSLAGGLAPGPVFLLVARAAQGLGGALVFPATLSLVNTTFTEGRARNRAVAV